MRIVLCVLSICSLAISPTAAETLNERQLGDIDISDILELPQCILPCILNVLPQTNCTSTECFCDMQGPVRAEMTTCIRSSCNNVDDQLATVRLAAKICKYPEHTDAPRVRTVSYAMFPVATALLALRFLYRCPGLRGVGYGWDDWCMLLCWPFALGLTLAAYYCELYGSGRDIWTLSAQELEKFFLWTYIGGPLYPTVTCLGKQALVLLYLRIWTPATLEPGSRFRLYCWLTLGFLIVSNIALSASAIFSCTPIEGGWNLHPGKPVKCANRVAQAYSLAAINIFQDFIVLLLPVRRVTKLKVGLLDKLGVLTMFMFGSLITICSIIRMFYLHKTVNVLNITYAYASLGVWSLIEVYGTLICGCVPAAAGFFRRYWQPFTSRITKSFRSAVTSSLSRTTKQDENANDTELFCTRPDSRAPIYDTEMDSIGSGRFKGHGTVIAARSVESHSDTHPDHDLEAQSPHQDSTPRLGILPDSCEEEGDSSTLPTSPRRRASIGGTRQWWYEDQPVSVSPLSRSEPSQPSLSTPATAKTRLTPERLAQIREMASLRHQPI